MQNNTLIKIDCNIHFDTSNKINLCLNILKLSKLKFDKQIYKHTLYFVCMVSYPKPSKQNYTCESKYSGKHKRINSTIEIRNRFHGLFLKNLNL